MQELTKGARLALAGHAPQGELQVDVSGQGLSIDFACFALDAAGKLVDDRYRSFFNQPASPCGGVVLRRRGDAVDGFDFRLALLPAQVERIVITASCDGGGVMSQLVSSLAAAGEPARPAQAVNSYLRALLKG